MTILTLSIPMLVEKNLNEINQTREVRLFVMLGGMIWLFAAYYSRDMYRFLGLNATDGNTYAGWAYERIIPILEDRDYGAILRWMASPGRSFYVASQGIFYYFTGATIISLQLINGFLGYWAGLILVRLTYVSAKCQHQKSSYLPFFLVFAPSVVFWCSSSLKEGLMYWSICNVFAFVVPERTRKRENRNFMWFIIGTFVGAFLRPHIIIFWCVSVISIKAFQKGFLKYALIIFLFAPFFMQNMGDRFHIGLLEGNIQKAENRMKVYIERGKKSTFDYGERRPIPVIDGLINTLFRPFAWQFRNLRSVLSSIEIWTISLSILFFWMRMSRVEWRHIWRNPAIWVACLVCIPFFAFFTYTVNEGLIVRQRIQLYPALLVLLATPILLRQRARCPWRMEPGAEGNGGLRAEDGCRRSKIRCRRTEIGDQMSDVSKGWA